MSFLCDCGCDVFRTDHTEVIVGETLVASDGQIYDTFHEETIEFDYTGKFRCDDCGKEYDNIFEEDGGSFEKDDGNLEEKWLKKKRYKQERTSNRHCGISSSLHISSKTSDGLRHGKVR